MSADVTILENSMIVRLNRVTMEVLETVSVSTNIDYKVVEGGESVTVKGTQQDMWRFLHSLSEHYTELVIE